MESDLIINGCLCGLLILGFWIGFYNNPDEFGLQNTCTVTFLIVSLFVGFAHGTLYPRIGHSPQAGPLTPLVIASMAVGLLIFLVWGITYYRSLGHYNRPRSAIVGNVLYYIAMLIACPFLASFYILLFNGLLDTSEPQRKQAILSRKTESHTRRKPSRYRFYVADLKHPDKPIELRVNSRIFNRVREGTKGTILTRSGFFGMEWLETVEFPRNPPDELLLPARRKR